MLIAQSFIYSKIVIELLKVFLLSHRLNNSLVSKQPRRQKTEDIVVTDIIRDGNDIKKSCFKMFILSKKVLYTSIFPPIKKRNSEINNEEIDTYRNAF